jgi:hypothetical protein
METQLVSAREHRRSPLTPDDPVVAAGSLLRPSVRGPRSLDPVGPLMSTAGTLIRRRSRSSNPTSMSDHALLRSVAWSLGERVQAVTSGRVIATRPSRSTIRSRLTPISSTCSGAAGPRASPAGRRAPGRRGNAGDARPRRCPIRIRNSTADACPEVVTTSIKTSARRWKRLPLASGPMGVDRGSGESRRRAHFERRAVRDAAGASGCTTSTLTPASRSSRSSISRMTRWTRPRPRWSARARQNLTWSGSGTREPPASAAWVCGATAWACVPKAARHAGRPTESGSPITCRGPSLRGQPDGSPVVCDVDHHPG